MKYDYIDLCDVPATLHGFYGCILILKCVHRICCIFVRATASDVPMVCTIWITCPLLKLAKVES